MLTGLRDNPPLGTMSLSGGLGYLQTARSRASGAEVEAFASGKTPVTWIP